MYIVRLMGDQASRMLLLAAILISVMLTPANCQTMQPLQVQGNQLVAGGQPFRLRGINWGWWNLSGTQYSQTDMSNEAQWGANVARLAFSYTDLETGGQAGNWSQTGFAEMDQVVQWAAQYHVYVILDMHVTPGGQNQDTYDDGGGDQLWTNAADQSNFLGLWKYIAQRYASQPAVAAYELMNEPDSGTISPDPLPGLCAQAITAIRSVAPSKIIVLAGNSHDGPANLTSEIYQQNQSNILYTMHFYNGNGDSWMNNLTDGPGASGTQGWTLEQTTFTAPANAAYLSVMLRSTANSGTAWFDDVSLTDTSGNIVEQDNFDTGTDGYSPERGPVSAMIYDSVVGHSHSGSLSVQGTTDYDGWVGPQDPIVAGKTYILSAWVRLSQATGDTYLSAAFYSNAVQPISALQTMMAPSVTFSQQYNVPVWVGEFGCVSTAPNGGQTQWSSDCISLFEQAGFDWTYWNFKETTSPAGMALEAEYPNGTNYPINSSLLSVLSENWFLNVLSGSRYLEPQCASTSCLDVGGASSTPGTPVQIWSFDGSSAQFWTITNMGGNQYKLVPACAPGCALDVGGAGTTNGTAVDIWTDNGSSAQRWIPTAVSGGFTFSPLCAPGLDLDVSGALSANGTNVQIWSLNGSSAQVWAVH